MLAASDLRRLGGILTTVGAAGVVIASALYAATPHVVALPEPFDASAARAGALSGAFTLRAAGSVGVVADVVLIAGALLVAASLRGYAAEALGWLGVALATAVFVGVDSIAGFVLVPLARTGGDAFEAFKHLFDGLFLLGAATFGASAWLAASLGSAAISKSTRAVAVFTVAAAVACMVGAPAGRAVGIAIAAGAALFVALGISLVRGSDRSATSSAAEASAFVINPAP